VKNVDK